MAYLDVSCITSWHAHVCFDAASRDPAREFREAVTARFDGAGGDKSIQANCSGWGGCARPRFRYAQRQGPSQTAPSCFGGSGAAGRVVRNA